MKLIISASYIDFHLQKKNNFDYDSDPLFYTFINLFFSMQNIINDLNNKHNLLPINPSIINVYHISLTHQFLPILSLTS